MGLSFTKRRRSLARPDGPRPGDILLFSHATRLGRIIPWFTGSRYYHIALYEGHGMVLEARPGGVVRRDITKEKNQVFRVIPMTEGAGQLALDCARARLGLNYDIVGVCWIILRHYFPRLRIPFENHNCYSCGEFVLDSWRRAGLDLLPGADATTVIPADFQPFLPPDSHDETLARNPH
ncbi:MAG: hypothetical protein KY445_10700 [Armatimonadetes bacterium]|nr:hypothetical protein [Armatimonadota bacterium]